MASNDGTIPRERLDVDPGRAHPFAIERAVERAPASAPAIARPEESPLLDALRTFLPTMRAANAALAADDARVRSIEIDDDDADGPRIEMDLGLGVVDLRDAAAVRAAARAAGEDAGDDAGDDAGEAVEATTLVVPESGTKPAARSRSGSSKRAKLIEEL